VPTTTSTLPTTKTTTLKTTVGLFTVKSKSSSATMVKTTTTQKILDIDLDQFMQGQTFDTKLFKGEIQINVNKVNSMLSNGESSSDPKIDFDLSQYMPGKMLPGEKENTLDSGNKVESGRAKDKYNTIVENIGKVRFTMDNSHNGSAKGPKVDVPAKGLFVPIKLDNADTSRSRDRTRGRAVLHLNGTHGRPTVSGHMSLLQAMSVETVFSRYWPAILGLTVGTLFLVAALLTSIVCRQQRCVNFFSSFVRIYNDSYFSICKICYS
jgi:hypothetical protein